MAIRSARLAARAVWREKAQSLDANSQLPMTALFGFQCFAAQAARTAACAADGAVRTTAAEHHVLKAYTGIACIFIFFPFLSDITDKNTEGARTYIQHDALMMPSQGTNLKANHYITRCFVVSASCCTTRLSRRFFWSYGGHEAKQNAANPFKSRVCGILATTRTRSSRAVCRCSRRARG